MMIKKEGIFMNRSYTDINSKTWDCWSDNKCEWSIPITHEEYEKAKNGEWGVYLTPCPLPFQDETFDVIFHPVSNCYIEDVLPVWKECYRILKKGGILLAGFDNGLIFLFEDDSPLTVVNKLPFNPLKMDKERYEKMVNNYEGIQFSHSMEEQLGGQLKAGFRLTDLYEDRDREGGSAIREYAPQYMATRAVKPE